MHRMQDALQNSRVRTWGPESNGRRGYGVGVGGRPLEHVELSSDGGYIRGQTVDGYKTYILLEHQIFKAMRTIESFIVGRPFCFYYSFFRSNMN